MKSHPHMISSHQHQGKTSEKSKEKKWIMVQRVKHPTPSQATDVLIGEEEQNLKQKRTKRKK